MTTTGCQHADGPRVDPRAEKCEECGSKVNLRACITCGHVGCCESQYGHNTIHARDAGHPVIRSLPFGQGSFTYCYECKGYV
jgi:uncharacterized UBP type Zn finger protein